MDHPQDEHQVISWAEAIELIGDLAFRDNCFNQNPDPLHVVQTLKGEPRHMQRQIIVISGSYICQTGMYEGHLSWLHEDGSFLSGVICSSQDQDEVMTTLVDSMGLNRPEVKQLISQNCEQHLIGMSLSQHLTDVIKPICDCCGEPAFVQEVKVDRTLEWSADDASPVPTSVIESYLTKHGGYSE